MLIDLALPLLRRLPPETAHRLTLRALRSGLVPHRLRLDPPSLAITLWGKRFPNPVGLAAGFDKNAEVPAEMLRLGFGFAECGTMTPRPQSGNPRPRLFRLREDEALINRLGFNNDGIAAGAARLARRKREDGIVGANIGKNRDTADDIADYVQGVTVLAPLADYLVVNVSSPNTPGLRELQRKSAVTALVERLMAARAAVTPEHAPPLLLKIAPDLGAEDRADLAQAALATGIDGLVVANTTVTRPASLTSPEAHEPGGLSGKPLRAMATALIGEMYRLTQGKLPIIGVGGIASGADAYEKIRAGASLVQLYTALVYQGPGLVLRVKRELAALLARDGYETLAAAVGSAAHSPHAPAHRH
ncbi:MAG TPA: quinone-dependent dihydroorotate dehydrogenase [Stellaceae bacterium]|nr:quinone-dependent dihydroorotate dehydrogenase [Stellaceae bacterium]